jgi:hypothetical protein
LYSEDAVPIFSQLELIAPDNECQQHGLEAVPSPYDAFPFREEDARDVASATMIPSPGTVVANKRHLEQDSGEWVDVVAPLDVELEVSHEYPSLVCVDRGRSYYFEPTPSIRSRFFELPVRVTTPDWTVEILASGETADSLGDGYDLTDYAELQYHGVLTATTELESRLGLREDWGDNNCCALQLLQLNPELGHSWAALWCTTCALDQEPLAEVDSSHPRTIEWTWSTKAAE